MRHWSFCRGGGSLPCGSRRRPSYPAFAPPMPPPLRLARRVLPTGTVVWSVPHPLSAASPSCRFVLGGGGGRCPPLPTFIPHPWGGGGVCVARGEPCRHPFVARMSLARRKHGAGTRRGTCPSAGGGACLVAPVVALPTLRSHPRWSPLLGLHGACSLRARLCGPSRTLSPLPPHPAALSSGGGHFSPPPTCIPHPWGGGGVFGGGGGGALVVFPPQHARRRHDASMAQARGAALVPLQGGGGGLDVCHPSSPLLPCVRTPGGAEVCVWGGRRPCHRPFCCTHVAGTTQARRKHGVRHLAEVRVGFRTRTAHGTTHGNYPLPCPLCSLPRPLCLLGAEQSPCLPRRSLSLPRLSGLPSPPKCPTSFTLPVPSFLVLASPRCMTLRRHTAHCTFRGRAALWQHAAAPRLAQCPRALRAARSVVGHLVAPFSALPSPTLCPPASASTVRSNSRGSAPPLPPSLPRPPGPVLPPVCSPRSPCPAPRPWLQGLRPPVPLSPSPLYPLGVHRAEQCARQPSHSLSPLLPPGVLSSWYVARTLYRTRYLRGQAA